MHSPRARFSLAAAGLCLLASPARAADPTPCNAAVHAGWWDVGADATSPGGLFAGLGVPWVPMLPLFAYSGQEVRKGFS